MPRRPQKPPIKQPYWIPEGKQWYAPREALLRAREACGASDEELQARMGYGYAALLAALDGARVDGWTAHFIEAMLEPRTEVFIPSSETPPAREGRRG